MQSILQEFFTARGWPKLATTLTNVFIAAYLLCGVLGGRVADRMRSGEFKANLAGALCWALGALLMALPRSPPLDTPTIAAVRLCLSHSLSSFS